MMNLNCSSGLEFGITQGLPNLAWCAPEQGYGLIFFQPPGFPDEFFAHPANLFLALTSLLLR